VLAIAADGQGRLHPRGVGRKVEVEAHLVDQEIGGSIVGQMDRLGVSVRMPAVYRAVMVAPLADVVQLPLSVASVQVLASISTSRHRSCVCERSADIASVTRGMSR